MARILVLYYSNYGHIQALAQAQAQGAQSLFGTVVDVRRIPETIPYETRSQAGFVLDDTPEVQVSDLADYDALILGSPTHFGGMAGPVKQFFDQAGSVWARNALVGKVGAAFTSTGSQHGGQEVAILSMHVPMLHFGMVIAGLPYSFKGQTTSESIIGGSPYGAGTISGVDGSLRPTETDLAGARYQGLYVAHLAERLAADPVIPNL